MIHNGANNIITGWNATLSAADSEEGRRGEGREGQCSIYI